MTTNVKIIFGDIHHCNGRGCRIFDMLHMGYVDEVLFGYEVVEELPRIVKEWVGRASGHARDKPPDLPSGMPASPVVHKS